MLECAVNRGRELDQADSTARIIGRSTADRGELMETISHEENSEFKTYLIELASIETMGVKLPTGRGPPVSARSPNLGPLSGRLGVHSRKPFGLPAFARGCPALSFLLLAPES